MRESTKCSACQIILATILALVKELALRKVVLSKQKSLFNKFLLHSAKRLTQEEPKPGLTVLAHLKPGEAIQLHIHGHRKFHGRITGLGRGKISYIKGEDPSLAETSSFFFVPFSLYMSKDCMQK